MQNATELQPEPTNGPRPIAAIINDLSRPVNPARLKTRKQGSATLQYLPWHGACAYLDHYTGGHWNYEIKSVAEVGGMCVVTVRITVVASDGSFYREATGIEPMDTKGYGDPVSNASSMALRRAAAHFGLARHLYDKP